MPIIVTYISDIDAATVDEANLVICRPSLSLSASLGSAGSVARNLSEQIVMDEIHAAAALGILEAAAVQIEAIWAAAVQDVKDIA